MSCSRRDFLATTLGAGALLTLGSGCRPPVAPDGIVKVENGQVLLKFTDFPRLRDINGGVTVGTEAGTPFAVVRTGATTALAINATCTHEACTAVYQAVKGDLECDCHGSVFGLDGAVIKGPAKEPLSMTYPAVVGGGDYGYYREVMVRILFLVALAPGVANAGDDVCAALTRQARDQGIHDRSQGLHPPLYLTPAIDRCEHARRASYREGYENARSDRVAKDAPAANPTRYALPLGIGLGQGVVAAVLITIGGLVWARAPTTR